MSTRTEQQQTEADGGRQLRTAAPLPPGSATDGAGAQRRAAEGRKEGRPRQAANGRDGRPRQAAGGRGRRIPAATGGGCSTPPSRGRTSGDGGGAEEPQRRTDGRRWTEQTAVAGAAPAAYLARSKTRTDAMGGGAAGSATGRTTETRSCCCCYDATKKKKWVWGWRCRPREGRIILPGTAQRERRGWWTGSRILEL